MFGSNENVGRNEQPYTYDNWNKFVQKLIRPGIHALRPGIYAKQAEILRKRLTNSKNQDANNSSNLNTGSIFSGSHFKDRETPNSRENSRSFLFVTCTFVLVIFVVLLEYYYLQQNTKEDEYLQLNRSIAGLREKFPNQTEHFWSVILAAAKPVLTENEPKHPGIILLAGPKKLEALSTCLAQRLSEAVRNAFVLKAPAVFFDSSQFKDLAEGNDVKHQLNNNFTAAFEDGTKVGVILSIESLPGKSPMIFYRLCDTANAPYKKVVIILTLNMEEKIQAEKDEAHTELRRLWESKLDKIHIEPIYSRIGNNIAYIRGDRQNCF